MDIDTLFFFGGKNGAVDFILNAPLQEFRAWRLDWYEQYPDERGIQAIETSSMVVLDDIIERGAEAFTPTTAKQAVLIDDFVRCFNSGVTFSTKSLSLPQDGLGFTSAAKLNATCVSSSETRCVGFGVTS